jgi:TonB family protein
LRRSSGGAFCLHVRALNQNQMIIKLTRLAAILIALANASALAQSTLKNVAADTLSCSYDLHQSGLPSSVMNSLPPSGLFATVRATLDPQGHVKDAFVDIPSGNAVFDSIVLQRSRSAKCKPSVGPDGNSTAVQTAFAFEVMPGSGGNPATDPVLAFASAVRQRIASNMEWGHAPKHTSVTIELHCSPDGHILSAMIDRSSGNPEWDEAALKAVQRSDPMPQDSGGKTPPKFKVTLRAL